MKNRMFVFEGNDGAGKSTAIRTVKQKLEERGYPVLLTREPGGSPIAEQIRELLLSVSNTMDTKTEALLYAAARREHFVSTLLPALEEGKIVLCDRFLDSSLAYQGVGRDLGIETIEALNDFGLEGFRPAKTLFFSLDLETEKRRMEERGDMNRLDLEPDSFHMKVRDGFDQLKNRQPDSYAVVDASQSREEVADQALSIILDELEREDA